MMKIHRILSFILAFCLLLGIWIFPTHAQEITSAIPTLSAESALLMEGESGAVVCQKNAHTRLPMASTTKIMTAIVALALAAPETVITVDASAVGTEGSSIYLTEGEQLTLEQLLYALLLESANDAAVAIAEALEGLKRKK